MLIEAAAHEEQMLAEDRGDYNAPVDAAYYFGESKRMPGPQDESDLAQDDALTTSTMAEQRSPTVEQETPEPTTAMRWRSFITELRDRQASPPSTRPQYKKTNSPGM
jgi:hypothetical protein